MVLQFRYPHIAEMPYKPGRMAIADRLEADDPYTARLYRQIHNPAKIAELYQEIAALSAPYFCDEGGASDPMAGDAGTAASSPALSVVAVTRNDTHVERMEDRTQAFIDGLLYLAESRQRRVEVILVEWNPPADRPCLARQFRFPSDHPHATVRVVTVPNALHRAFSYADDLPLYQMIGKNVGIRRARGRMILATNVDVLLSPAAFDALTDESLPGGRLYRSNRWDVDRAILDAGNIAEMIGSAGQRVLAINTADGLKTPDQADAPGVGDTMGGILLPRLHTWACGDFQAMHRDDWRRLRGYAEVDGYSFHLDSLLSYACLAAGIDEADWGNEAPHYHIDHTLGAELSANTYRTQEKKALPHVSMHTVYATAYAANGTGKYVIWNRAGWGLWGLALADETVTRGGWDDRERPWRATESQTGAPESACPLAIAPFEETVAKAVEAFVARNEAEASVHLRSRLESEDRPVAIFGTGRGAVEILSFVNRAGGRVAEFVLSEGASVDPALPEGSPLVAENEALQHKDQRFLLVASSHADKVIPRLDAAGLVEGRDYLVLV